MKGQIDASFSTLQRDMFESGLAAEIGPGAMLVWLAIKHHANYSTGVAWPGIRRICELTGLTDKPVMSHIKRLVAAHLLRIDSPGTKRTSARYTALERMDVRLGDYLLCRVVIDYVPAQIQEKLRRIAKVTGAGKPDPEAWVGVTIIPGPGFQWDAAAGVLRGAVPRSAIPVASLQPTPESLAAAVLGLEKSIPALSKAKRAAKLKSDLLKK